MISDTDLIGIISASCILFVFLCGFMVCMAVICYRRMEINKRKEMAKKAIRRRKKRQVAKAIADFPSGGSLSETTDEASKRMSSYRPKILGRDVQPSLSDHLSRESSESRDERLLRAHEPRHSSDESKIVGKRAVSVIYVNGKDNIQNSGHMMSDTKVNGQVFQGHVSIPQRNSEVTYDSNRTHAAQGYIENPIYGHATLNHIVHQHVEEQRPVQIHQAKSNSGEIIRGHIIKQTVAMGVDGHLVITGSDQRDFNDAVNKKQNHGIGTAVSSGLIEQPLSRIITETVKTDTRNQQNVSKYTEKTIESHTDTVEIRENNSHSEHFVTVVDETVANINFDDSSSSSSLSSVNIGKQETRRLHITTDRSVNSGDYSEEELLRKYDFTHQTPTELKQDIHEHLTPMKDVKEEIHVHQTPMEVVKQEIRVHQTPVTVVKHEAHHVTITTEHTVNEEDYSEGELLRKYDYVHQASAVGEDYTEGELLKKYDYVHPTPAVVVVTSETDDSETNSSIDVRGGRERDEDSFSTLTEKENSDDGSRRPDDSISMFYNDTKNYKVIKKHSAHKPPDWLVQTYAEAAASADVVQSQRDSSTQSVQTVETSVVTSTSSVGLRKEGPKVSFTEIATQIHDSEPIRESWTSEQDSDSTYPEPDYPLDDETVTVTEYLDSENNEAGRVVTRTFSDVQTSEDGAVTTMRTMTATAMRQIRHNANENLESMALQFRSPRAPWEAKDSQRSSVDSSSLQAAVTSHTRQGSTHATPKIVEIE